MSLSCSCYDDGEWWYFTPDDYSRLGTKRSRRCCSCKAIIKPGDLCNEYKRECNPDEWSVDARIYGSEKPLASWYHCEACADLFWNLDELGFCINLPADMRALTREYAAMRMEK